MAGRKEEFAAGADPQSTAPKTSREYAQDLGFESQADMRGEDW